EQRLYVGGWFDELDGAPLRSIAVYDEGRWRQLGDAFDGVTAMAIAELGAGEASLYASGWEGSGEEGKLARWDGAQWTTVAESSRGDAHILSLHDADGPGPAPTELIAGGVFTMIGGVEARQIASYNGATWSPLGDGLEDYPIAIASHDADG